MRFEICDLEHRRRRWRALVQTITTGQEIDGPHNERWNAHALEGRPQAMTLLRRRPPASCAYTTLATHIFEAFRRRRSPARALLIVDAMDLQSTRRRDRRTAAKPLATKVPTPSHAADSPEDEPRPKPQLRERAMALGVGALDDASIVGLLVERGVAGERLEDRVARLLEEAGGLEGLATLGASALAFELSLGVATGCRLAAAVELGVRLARSAADRRSLTLASARDVERWARRRLSELPHEELWALMLDGRNRVVAERMIARGGVHACAASIADILRPIVREASSAFALVHNHPSGDPTPSVEDVRFTRRVRAGARAIGVTLIDHVVVAREGCVSMAEAGLMAAIADSSENLA